MSNNAINGAAHVAPTAPVLAPNRATWTVDVEAKTSSAELLGGKAVIGRNAVGSFACTFSRPLPPPNETSPGGAMTLSFPLNDCEHLALAQARAETVIRENMSKTHPAVFAEATANEVAEIAAPATTPDPF